MTPPAQGPDDDDAVARNRAAPRRRTPGRTQVGHDVTRRLGLMTVGLLVATTIVLIVFLLIANAA